jgi:hypothetical protein
VIRRQSLIAAAVVSLASSSLASRVGAQERGAIYPTPFRAMVALNPLGIPFEIFAAEAEGVILPGITLGGSVSHTAISNDEGDGQGDPRFTSGDVKVRYYPGEVALNGFSVGLGLGVTSYSELRSVGTPTTPLLERRTLTAPTISVESDYNFLLGARQRFIVGTGIGAKRLLASGEDRRRADAPRAYAYARFVLGLAF